MLPLKGFKQDKELGVVVYYLKTPLRLHSGGLFSAYKHLIIVFYPLHTSEHLRTIGMNELKSLVGLI